MTKHKWLNLWETEPSYLDKLLISLFYNFLNLLLLTAHNNLYDLIQQNSLVMACLDDILLAVGTGSEMIFEQFHWLLLSRNRKFNGEKNC